MKLSSISILLVLALGCGIAAAQPPKAIEHPTSAIKSSKSEKIQQKFNPIYGSEQDANDLLSFIAANMVLELDAESVRNIDGIAVVSFYLDTLGNIDRLAVTKSLRSWIDYALIGGMKRLPAYGRPSTRKNGKVFESFHNVVFSFGSYVRVGKHTYGFQGETVSANIQKEIDRQRNEQIARAKEHNDKWSKFTTKNARLEYDTKNGLKNQAGTLAPDDQIGTPDNLPPLMPTVTIKNKE